MRCSMRFLLYLMALMMLLCVADPLVFAKDKESKLPPQYREWLDRDVAYIITRGEKTQFLSLTSDAERDKFIDWFWAIRQSGSRLAGQLPTRKNTTTSRLRGRSLWHREARPGWSSDSRTNLYNLLGAPKQTANYNGFDRRSGPCRFGSMRPMSQGYPLFFSVLFYKRDSFGDL